MVYARIINSFYNRLIKSVLQCNFIKDQKHYDRKVCRDILLIYSISNNTKINLLIGRLWCKTRVHIFAFLLKVISMF